MHLNRAKLLWSPNGMSEESRRGGCWGGAGGGGRGLFGWLRLGLGLGLVALVGCGAAEESVCMEPASGWQERLLDRDAIEAEVAALPADRAREMYDAGCVAVPRGVDSRNQKAIYARPFCDDNCVDDARWTVILYYDGITTSDACAAAGGCSVMMGAIPGSLAACIPDGALVWPTGWVCTSP